MSKTAAALTASNANRRFLLLAIGLGLLGAVLVFAALSRNNNSSGGVADTPVVVAKSAIPARTKITPSMVEVRLVPAADAGQMAYSNVDDVVGRVTRFPLVANEQVLSSKIVDLSSTTGKASNALSFVVPEGMRGFAIQVSEVQTAGGLVLPGDYVDVLVIYDVEFLSNPADPSSREKADAYLVQTLLQNVEVLAVAQKTVDLVPEATPTVAGAQRERITEGTPNAEATTVTLAVTPDQAQRLFLAEGNGKIRLSVRHYGDATQQPIDYMTEVDLFPRNLPNPFLR